MSAEHERAWMALALAGALAAWASDGRARADCQGGACSDPHTAQALAPSADLSPGAREAVAYLDAWAGYRAMSLRYGRAHPDMIARLSVLAALASELDAVRAEGASIARDEVIGWLRTSILDVEARLAELGSRCGPQHLDLRGAESRRDALRDALTHWQAGEIYLPAAR